MNRTPVNAERLKSVGYDEPRHVLEIELRNSSVYQYFGVPPGHFRSLMRTPMKDAFFERFIERGKFEGYSLN